MSVVSNENLKHGYHYTISDDQLEAYQKLSIEERFEWLEAANEFLFAVQTPEERERMNKLRRGESW